MRLWLPTAVLVLGLAVPAAAQNPRERQMMADIRMLQEQTQQLQTQLEAAIATLTDALKSINGRIDDQLNANRKAFADQKLNVDQLAGDLRVVRERVSETNVRISSMSQEIEALRLAIPQYPPPTASVDPNVDPTAPAPPGTPPGGVPSLPPMPSPVGTGVSPQRMYDTAWTDYTSGQWTLCIEGFSQYLRTFPRTDLADEAQYYIGECYFAENKFTEAIDAYTRVIANYPKGDAAPVAYYKRGLTFDRLGQPDRARDSWETLLKLFPEADAARLAKQGLARLKPGA